MTQWRSLKIISFGKEVESQKVKENGVIELTLEQYEEMLDSFQVEIS